MSEVGLYLFFENRFLLGRRQYKLPASEKELVSLLKERLKEGCETGALDLSGFYLKSIRGISSLLGEKCVKKIRELDLSNNEIYAINTRDLEAFVNLEYLDLSFNKIVKIETKAFKPLKNLISLDLGHNKIKKLFPKMFVWQGKLKFLDLSDNKIRYLEKSFFDGLFSSLQKINLADNRIIHIPADLFKRFKRLNELNLKGNLIKIWQRAEGNIREKRPVIERDILTLWW